MSYNNRIIFGLDSNDSENNEQSDRWLLTFADLLSLIITFFVLIYSMTALNADKWKMITISLSQKLNPDKKVERTLPSADVSITKLDIPHAKSLEYLNVVLLDKIGESEILQKIMKTNLSNEKLTINIQSDMIFQKGDVIMSKKGELIFDIITNILKTFPNRINIYGYANDEPHNLNKYPSKWELSLTRALVISKILKNKGYEYNILSYGLADRRNNSNEKNIKINSDESIQYVDVVIRKEDVQD